ncbi:hypothetical protein [Oceanobacillus neutriphilus]|uniref:Uncharacterized protein n=1 Tax=Oceanobacillus neutriphilus TaxID=531815 RepID=A0ABQ2NRH5_9BACI|nr:hypothetical protein [Oceanobacillus neutriphilus]GGP09042.1 hypothetical protein GCM10011346_11510 [Oceanobacillus neutriphilus]
MAPKQKNNSGFSKGWIFFSIPFLIPFIIIGFMFYKGYTEFQPEKERADQLLHEAEALSESVNGISEYYMLPNGHGLTARSADGTILLEEVDPAANTIVQTEQLDSDIFMRSFVSYQKDGLVFITKANDNNMIKAYYYESGKELTKLDIPEIQAEGYLESHVLSHQGTIYLLGKKNDGSFSLYSIHDVQLEEIDLTENEQIVDLVDAKLYYSSSFTDLLPAVELSLYDQSQFMLTFSPKADERFLIPEAASFWETEEEAVSKLYQGKESTVIRIADNQLVQYDIHTHTVQNEIPTPEPIYYPNLIQLDTSLTLVIGRKSVEESSALIGYVFNQAGEEMVADLTKMLQGQSFDYSNDAFFAQATEEELYIASDRAAISVNLADPSVSELLTPESVEKSYLALAEEKQQQAEKLTQDSNTFSKDRLLQYIREDSAGQTFTIIIAFWVGIPLLIMIIIFMFSKLSKWKRKRILNNGGIKVRAKITQINQTGTYINEQPQVRMKVEFTYQHNLIQREVKQVVSLLYPPRPGDFVDLLYDPRSGKVYLWKD